MLLFLLNFFLRVYYGRYYTELVRNCLASSLCLFRAKHIIIRRSRH